MSGLLLACGLSVCLGVVAARLMRVTGLVLVLAALILGAGAGYLAGLAHPTWGEAALVLVLAQAGYLLGALLPAARRAGTPSPLAQKDDRAAG